MKKLTLIFFALVTLIAFRGEGRTHQFCGERGLPEKCSFDKAIKIHKADDQVLKTAQSFVGSIRYPKKVGTAFIVRTEKCRDNDMILTNAHVAFDRWSADKKNIRLRRSGKFCLIEEGKCSEIDLSESAVQKMNEFNLTGNADILPGKEDRFINTPQDFSVLFLKKPIETKEVLPLSYMAPDSYLNQEIVFTGMNYHSTRRVFYKQADGTSSSKTFILDPDTFAIKNCSISHISYLYRDEKGDETSKKIEERPLLHHNCHTRVGASGAPMIYQNKVFAIGTFGYREPPPKNYNGNFSSVDNPIDYSNSSIAIRQELIDNLNNYCASRK